MLQSDHCNLWKAVGRIQSARERKKLEHNILGSKRTIKKKKVSLFYP